ncbi:subtilisin-like protein, partial [Anaeromyces robustus]
MIAAETKEEDTIDALDYVLHYGKRYKSVISLSRGGFYYSGTTEKKIHDLVERGFIIIVSAGNDNKDACGKKGSKQFRSYTGYKDTIAVGAVQSTISNNKYTGAYYSNYGECIDIFGPGSVMTPNVGHYDVDYKKKQGTSFSTPMVAGVVA